MSWPLPRVFPVLLMMAAGAAIGFIGGAQLHAPNGAAIAGGVLGMVVAMLVDGLRAARLMTWLRGEQQGRAPRGTGFWGELGYRVERALRSRELALEHERERLRQFLAAIDAAPNGVVLLDASDQIEWCNAVAADQLGLDPLRDRRQPITNLVRMPVFVAYLHAGEWRDAVTVTMPARAITLSMRVHPYGDGHKLVIAQDVTERLRADAMRRDFVANVSHEIRTPLTVLAGFVETLGSLPLGEVERRRVLQLMQQQTDRMQVLVSDLLRLAQLEGSPRPTAERWVSVARLLRQATADAQALSAGRQAITLRDSDAAEVAGAEAELQSAVANLLSNAVRHTPAGGRIDVTWHTRADGGGEIAVRDTGIGIAREHLPRLAERFYRVDSSRSRDSGGTGLGLAIVKHVMQRHGGELIIDSEAGRGSLFRLLLPAGRVRNGQDAAFSEGLPPSP